MGIRLTILCDNSVAARPGLIGEHGFACHIATTDKQYLFDTGNGLGLLSNALTCGIDLTRLDAVLLSHGHWDHCGGLMSLLKLRRGQPTTVYAHPAIFDEKFSSINGVERPIGTDFSRVEAETAGANFLLSREPVELPGGLTFSGEIPRLEVSDTEESLCYRQAGGLLPDPLLDDQSLYLQTESGLVILCGCAHAGMRNILTHAMSLTEAKNLHALIGGLHLSFSNNEQMDAILKDISQQKIQLLAACHCTGQVAIHELMKTLGSTVVSGAVSNSFHFDSQEVFLFPLYS